MAKVGDKKLLLLSDEEHGLLSAGKEYDLIPNQKGIFLLIDKTLIGKNEGKQVCVQVPEKKSELEEEAQQVLGMVKKGALSELVEGKFEETLNEKQRKALLALVAEGKIFVFKLNESYKKGVYRVKEEEFAVEERKKKDSETAEAKEKAWNEYNLDQDGFLIIKGKDSAARASMEYEKEIKEGLLRGIRSFDGNYYLLQTDLLNDYIKKILSSMEKQPTQTCNDLSKTINASKTLTSIICEFLKEEGELLERKKGAYTYVK